MIRSLLHRYLSGFERRYDYDATYLHELADISPRAFWRFASVQLKPGTSLVLGPLAPRAARRGRAT